MPKRKSTSINASPTQPSLSHFLTARKQAAHPTVKRAKIEEAGPPTKPTKEEDCKSTVCSSTSDSSELVTILELIDEVILFAGKTLLWSHIQEEIHSLHRRSIELVQLKKILGVMNEYYTIDTGYRKLPQGGYKPEYQLSIPKSQERDRAQRLQKALQTMDTVSEYELPKLPTQILSLMTPVSEKKTQLIKSLPTTATPKPITIAAPQKPISIFLRPTKSASESTSLASRKSSLLERIRAKKQVEQISPATKSLNAAWERGEWCISALFLYRPFKSKANYRMLTTSPGKSKIAVSLNATIKQMGMSSPVPMADKSVRDVIEVVCSAVPWFCRIVNLSKDEGCMSSQSILKKDEEKKENENTVTRVFGGKENGKVGRDVEGLLIFARSNGKLIGSEDVLREFRMKRGEWDKRTV